MASTLYVVRKRNPFLRPGTFVRLFDHGFEQCITRTVDGRLQIVGYSGMIFSEDTLKPFISAVLSRGLDNRCQNGSVGGNKVLILN
jgi:hypothetical protein